MRLGPNRISAAITAEITDTDIVDVKEQNIRPSILLCMPGRYGSPAVRSWIAVRVMNANLATLIETPGVLDAGAFAIVFCGAETLLICVEGPREDENDQTHGHRCEDPHVLDRSSHVRPLDWPVKVIACHIRKATRHVNPRQFCFAARLPIAGSPPAVLMV